MRKSYDKITDSEKLEVIRLYNNKHTINEINIKMNISNGHVFNILKKYNVKLRKQNNSKKILTSEILRQIRNRIEHGETQRRIAEEYEVHESTISNALKRNNI